MSEDREQVEITQEAERSPDRRQDRLSAVVFALILIWAGLVLLAHNVGFLDVFENALAALPLPGPDLPWSAIPFLSLNTWRVFFLGAAGIVLLELLIRLLVPAYRRRILGTVIGGIILIAIGLGSWSLAVPSVLIAVGAYMLLKGVFQRQEQ
jgi:hypothetical protein